VLVYRKTFKETWAVAVANIVVPSN